MAIINISKDVMYKKFEQLLLVFFIFNLNITVILQQHVWRSEVVITKIVRK